MTIFVIPVGLLCAGVACLVFAKQIGVAFCRLGKAIWFVQTFGLTDMRWFYSEEKAPRTFRFLGIICILFSIPWSVIAIASISGPGQIAAIWESRSYLGEQFGSASSYSLSTKPSSTGPDDYSVIYRYGAHAGTLHAQWQKNHYVFSEEQHESSNPAALPRPDKGQSTQRRPPSGPAGI